MTSEAEPKAREDCSGPPEDGRHPSPFRPCKEDIGHQHSDGDFQQPGRVSDLGGELPSPLVRHLSPSSPECPAQQSCCPHSQPWGPEERAAVGGRTAGWFLSSEPRFLSPNLPLRIETKGPISQCVLDPKILPQVENVIVVIIKCLFRT